MLTRVLSLAALASLAACVDTVDEPSLGSADQAATKCLTCDDNGLPPGSWQQAPLQLGPTVLGPAGIALPSGTIRALCQPGTATTTATGTSCALAVEWSTWAGVDPVRSDLLRYIIRVGAGKGDLVSNPATGTATAGAFGLARTALTTPWNERVQSIITAGMTVNVDFYSYAVEICIKTEFTPDCPAAYSYQELAAAGNLFANRREVVIGGHAANAPDESQRVCPGGLTICNHYSARTLYSAATCGYAGATAQRYPTTCTDPAGGPAFDYPVQVFTTWNPAVMGAAPYGGPML
ncbi:MAG: hypothetical protein IPH44_21925 [Myxococcales bacterium]|nr:hypothetical protein [Myxococcales bacterium]